MNKVTQIWKIVFPNGIFFTYIPSGFNFLFQASWISHEIQSNISDLTLLILVFNLTWSIYFIFDTYRKRRRFRLLFLTFESVKEELDKIFDQEMANGINEESHARFEKRADRVIDAEIERRKRLERTSKSGKR